MGFIKKLGCGCDDKCKGYTLHSDETIIIVIKTGKLIYRKIDASLVRSREIINKAIEEVYKKS